MRYAILLSAVMLTACGDRSTPPANVASSTPIKAPATEQSGSSTSAPAPTTPDPLADYRGHLAARATEPFWSLDISPSQTLAFHELATERAVAAPYAAPSAAEGGGARFAAGGLTAVIRTAACSDGMSDFTYPMTAEVREGGVVYKGCAYPRWDNRLVEWLPQIDACLARAPTRGPVSSVVSRRDGVHVRVIVEAEDPPFECVVADGAVVRAATVTEPEPWLGERNPIFYRAPGQNPGGECFEAREARSPSGELLGWLAPDEAC